MKSAVVLLSGGLDSTVNFFAALNDGLQVKLAVTFNYGQRAAEREIAAAAQICNHAKIPHQVIGLPWLKNITNTALVNLNENVPQGANVKIDDYEQSMSTAKSVWVPNRNGVFLNIAAALAEANGADYVIPGFNFEEAQTFPDNSHEYLEQTTKALSFSTANKVQAHCYTVKMNKTQIVQFAKTLDVPFKLIWSCYMDGQVPCGTCESCQRLGRALQQNEQTL